MKLEYTPELEKRFRDLIEEANASSSPSVIAPIQRGDEETPIGVIVVAKGLPLATTVVSTLRHAGLWDPPPPPPGVKCEPMTALRR